MGLRRSVTFSFAILAAAASLLVTTALPKAAGLTPREQKLVAAAKREGAVTGLNPQLSGRTRQKRFQ